MRADRVSVIVINGLTQIRALGKHMRGGLITGDISLYRLAATNRQTRVRPDFVQNCRKGQTTAFTVAVFMLDMQLLLTLHIGKKRGCMLGGSVSRALQRGESFPASSGVARQLLSDVVPSVRR